MTKQRAKVLTVIASIFALTGLIVGINLPEDALHANKTGQAILCSYMFWSLFWGVTIVHKPILGFFPTIFYSGSNVFNILSKHIYLQLTLYLVILGVGYIVGAFGGAIIKQIQMIIILIK